MKIANEDDTFLNFSKWVKKKKILITAKKKNFKSSR